MIVYKVVTHDRLSCYVRNRKYRKFYRKNKIVHATEGTLGIFCFKERIDAADFIKYDDLQEIIRVKSIGRAKYPSVITGVHGPDLNDFYKLSPRKRKFPKCFCSYSIPKGTVCYPAVEVLE